jgi:Fe-S-cluster-containing hydrogenase component 2
VKGTLRLELDAERCTGCWLCAIYCSVRTRGQVDPARASITVLHNDRTYQRTPFTCLQCPSMPCAAACPLGAITRQATGALTVDPELCVACGLCVDACPYGNMLLFAEDAHASKCDLCAGDPQCAAVCPQGAIAVVGGAVGEDDVERALDRARRALDAEPVRRAAG